jgi:hypothetical protein
MFRSSQIAAYRTGSESLATQLTHTEKKVLEQESSSFLQNYYKVIIDIFKSHVIPVLQTDPRVLEVEFNKQLSDFSKKMDELNRTTFEKAHSLQEIMKFIFTSYDLLEQTIKMYKLDFEEKVLNTLGILRDFDDVYLGIVMDRPEQLSKALNDIRDSEDFENFEKSRTGTVFAFFCLLAYVKEEINDKQKLSKLIEIADKYSTRLLGWVDTIDIMSNPEEVKKMEEAEDYYNKIINE